MRAEKKKKKTCVGDIEQTEKWKSLQKRHETQEKCKKSCKDDGPFYQHVHGNVLTLCKKQVHTIIVAFRKRAHRPITYY